MIGEVVHMTQDPLNNVIANNHVTIIADIDHEDNNIAQYVANNLENYKNQGVTDIWLEHDAKDYSPQQVMGQPNGEGDLASKANQLGINVHLYDDRSQQRELNSKFPEEAAYARQHDTYFDNPDALIQQYHSPDKMEQYINEKRELLSDISFRNERMADNLAGGISNDPHQKSLVMVGAAHVYDGHDVDELLSQRGVQSAVVELNSKESFKDAALVHAPDKPDFIIGTEAGNLLAYKDPQTQKMHAALQGVDIPWKPTEPFHAQNVDKESLGNLKSNIGNQQQSKDVGRSF